LTGPGATDNTSANAINPHPSPDSRMAVYTDIPDEEFDAFMRGYNLGPVLSLKGIAEGVENSNYLLVTERGQFILTLYEKRVDAADLPFFLGLMEHLAGRGITCPLPVHDRSGKALGRLAGRPAAIVTFLSGMWVRRPRAEHCAAVGAALARLHVAGEGFALTRRNALSVQGWRPLFDACNGRADEVAIGLGAEIAAELDALERQWPRTLPTGVIHADLFPDNVFFLGGKLSGLIDFYFACNDMFAYDVAVCLNAWCFESDGALNVTKARSLLTAYQAARPLSAGEIAALPLLARGAALRFLLTRLYDWLTVPPGALVVPKDPIEYYRKLRFHRGVTDVRAYGIDR
jgi:homoserine kinase type II